MLDGFTDSQGDGIVDSSYIDMTDGVETKGDGNDESDLDVNGDDSVDLFTNGAQIPSLPSVIGDSLPDVDQVFGSVMTTKNAVYRTGLKCGGYSVSHGAGTHDLMSPPRGLFASSGIFIRGTRVLSCAVKSPRVSAMVLLVAGCSVLSLTSVDPLQATELSEAHSNSEQSGVIAEPVQQGESFQKRYYLGLGFGRS